MNARSTGGWLAVLVLLTAGSGCGRSDLLPPDGTAETNPPPIQGDDGDDGDDAPSGLRDGSVPPPPPESDSGACSPSVLTDEPTPGAFRDCWMCIQKTCARTFTACANECACNDAIVGALDCVGSGGTPTSCFTSSVSASADSTLLSVATCLEQSQGACCSETPGGTDGGVTRDAGPDAGPTRDAGVDAGPIDNGGPECRSAGDCEGLLGPLPTFCVAQCPGGGEGCEHYVCLSGVCQTTYCNDPVEPAGPECQTPGDCETLLGPLPGLCVGNCPNGMTGCEHYLCLSGLCQTSYCN